MSPSSAYLDVHQAAAHLRVSASYLNQLRSKGGGPKFIRINRRHISYRPADLDAWATAHSYSSTSEYEKVA
jgi:hypothetical protein